MLRKIAIGASLLGLIAASGVLLAARATPERQPGGNVPAARAAAEKPLGRLCEAGEAADTRPDPAWVGASYANDNCRAPRMPAPVDGFTASRAQIVAGMAAEKNYAALSDAYQRCIGDFVIARKAEAGRREKPMTMALAVIETHRIAASQRNKKRVAAQIGAAINAFNEYGSECPDQ